MSSSSSNQKRLLHNWQFWVIIYRYIDGAQYEVEPIIKVGSIENFVRYFRSLPKMGEITFNTGCNTSLAFFSEDIKPAWEDQGNQGGASFSFLVPQDKINDIWKNLLIDAVRGELDRLLLNEEKENINARTEFVVVGVMATPKYSQYKVELWVNMHLMEKIGEDKDKEEEIKKIVTEYLEGIELGQASCRFNRHGSKKK